jgi:hypothetical protein
VYPDIICPFPKVYPDIICPFPKVYLDVISLFPKAGPRKTGGRKYGKSRILTYTPEETETENQRAKQGKRKYRGKTLKRKL